MQVKAKLNNLKISPRKTRLVVDVIRGLKVEDALNQLSFTLKKSSLPLKKLVESAIANAENTFELKKDNLFVKEIRVDEGATMKRWMPRARGRATTVRKRTSKIILVLDELVDSGKKTAKEQKIDEPVKLDSMMNEDKKKSSDKEEKNPDNKKDGHGKNNKSKGKETKGFSSKIFRRKTG